MNRSIVAVALLAASFVQAQDRLPPDLKVEEPVADANKTKILFIAGTSVFKPGEHDYIADCRVLMRSVAQTPNVAPVLALDWPAKAETWSHVSSVVFFFDGAEKHQAVAKGRAERIQALLDKGVGLVQMHQTADYPDSAHVQGLAWAGGAWKKGTGKRAHWVESFKTFPDHPVFRGVGPFTIDDGWLWNIRFAEGMKGVTPLLRTVNPKSKDDPAADAAIVAWAYERPMGGRSFTFTGGHLNKSLADANYRRFLTNGILWSAGKDIPKTVAAD